MARRGGPGTAPEGPAPATVAQRIGRSGTNLVFASGAELLSRAAGLVSLVYLARYLQPERFGAFNTLLAWFAIAAAAGNFGVDRLLLRDFARAPNQEGHALPTLFTLRVAAGVVAALGLAVMGVREGMPAEFALAGVAVVLTNLSSTLALVFYAREEFAPPSAAGSATSLVMAVACVAAAMLRAPFVWFPAALVAAECVRLGWLYAASLRARLAVRAGFSRTYAAYLLRAGLPFGMLAVAGAVHFRGDLLVLEWLRGEESAGYYASAYRILEVLLVLPNLLVAVMIPRFARLLHTDPAAARALYLAVTRVLVWSGAVAGAAGAAAGPFLLDALYTERYAPAIPAFQVLMAAAVLLFWSAPAAALLAAGDHPWRVVRAIMLATAANLAANLVLIPRMAATGAALATCLSEALSLVLLTGLVCRALGVSPRAYLWGLRPVLSGADRALLLGRPA
jgi:O-antigen/teichoic acid export membrane protein